MTEQIKKPRPGLHLKITVLVLSVLLVIAGIRYVRGAGPIEKALDEIGKNMGTLVEVEAHHFREAGQVTDAAALGPLEEGHAREVNAHLEGVYKILVQIEACAEEGGAHRMPWMTELLGRLKQEEGRHGRAMSGVKEVGAAQAEEGRHQREMEGMLKDLAGEVEKAKAEEREHGDKMGRCKGVGE